MGYRENLYNLVLVLHILCAIVGFGTVFLNGMYAAKAKAAGGREAYAIGSANFAAGKVAEYFIYGVFVFGLLMVFLSDTDGVQVIPWSDMWLSLSMLLYIVGIGLSHAVLIPSEKKALRLEEEMLAGSGGPAAGGGPPPQVAELEQLGKKMALTGTVLNVLVVVVLVLMVFKPGAENL